MKKQKEQYSCLPGRSRQGYGIFNSSRYRLWLTSDHLLYVCTSPYFSESYKRFYLKDIQAISLTRTNKWRNITWIFGLITAFFGFFSIMSFFNWGTNSIAGITFGALAFLPGVLLLSNIIQGPTCACHLYTAVQSERLYSQGRMRAAQKTINMLLPLITAAQGRLTPDDLDASSEQKVAVIPAAHVKRN